MSDQASNSFDRLGANNDIGLQVVRTPISAGRELGIVDDELDVGQGGDVGERDDFLIEQRMLGRQPERRRIE